MSRRQLRFLLLASLTTVGVLVFARPQDTSGSDSPSQLAANRTGYIDTRLCAGCHSTIYETYHKTGMARSFFRPRRDDIVEDYRLNNHYYHRASDTHFEMLDRNGRYYQRRYQIGPDGKETNIDEKEIDFVMGSGEHVRTYLHRNRSGALLELPLAWYAEKGGYWAMNPGYDKPDQQNSRRQISYECMFCHNAYPAVPAGSTQLHAEPIFAGALPEGIDCQRCHGPGELHVQTAQRAGAAADAIRAAIVNPARLTRERQMEVCMQCHLETTSIPFPHSITKYDRGQFSYRPGQRLADFMLFFDHAPAGPAEDRVEIVNSAYRLRMSPCFLKSEGALQCTTCHNPHVSLHDQPGTQQYNEVCLRCHAARLRAMAATPKHTASSNCVECHMPKRRTSDVVHAVMTDHYIQRRRPERDLLAEIPEPSGSAIEYRGEVLPYYPTPLERGGQNDLYVALAQVRFNNNLELGITRFATAVEKYQPKQAEFYIELADAWLRVAQAAKAVPLYEEALRRSPGSIAASAGLGAALEAAGRPVKAIEAFQRALQLAPRDALLWQELGQVYVKQGRKTEALGALQKSLEFDSGVPQTYQMLGALWAEAENAEQAEAAYQEAIRLQPDYAQAHTNLAILLSKENRFYEAAYHFEYALRLKPDYLLGHYNYAMMLLRDGHIDQAMRHLQETVRLDSHDAEEIRADALRILSELDAKK